MLARHILSRRLARDRLCAVDREDAPRPVGRVCLRQRNGMADLGGHDPRFHSGRMLETLQKTCRKVPVNPAARRDRAARRRSCGRTLLS